MVKTIACPHLAYHGGMARLSWPRGGWFKYRDKVRPEKHGADVRANQPRRGREETGTTSELGTRHERTVETTNVCVCVSVRIVTRRLLSRHRSSESTIADDQWTTHVLGTPPSFPPRRVVLAGVMFRQSERLGAVP